MKRSPHPSTALTLISMVFATSTFLTLYMVAIQEGIQQQQYEIVDMNSEEPFLHSKQTNKPSTYKKPTQSDNQQRVHKMERFSKTQSNSSTNNSPYLGRRTKSLTLDMHNKKLNAKSKGADIDLNLLSNYSKHFSTYTVWPDQHGDRIMEQLELAQNMGKSSKERAIKVIVLKSTFDDIWSGYYVFRECPVKECVLSRTVDQTDMVKADAIMFGHVITDPYPYHLRSPHQIWIYFNLESSANTKLKLSSNGSSPVNWTATYRRDSTIVTPYEKFMLFPNMTSLPQVPKVNYAAGKMHKVAWFVSNCGDGNGRRTYAKQLSEYISVHVYGACGQRKCPRTTEEYCFNKLQTEYKFYLAFENSNCRDYITEKFFRNALMHSVLPIVMGAPREDYEKVAPPQSFIHVDDFPSPRHMAEYLHMLDRDDALYNQYFRWRDTGHFIDTRFFCRLCAMLHSNSNAAATTTKTTSKTASKMSREWQGASSSSSSQKRDLMSWWNDQQCIQPNMWASWKRANKHV